MEIDNYISKSLKTHLFFARILKEHAIFIELSCLEINKDIKSNVRYFNDIFSDVLNSIVLLIKKYITDKDMIEMVTEYTLESEELLNKLSGINIDTNITKNEISFNFDNSLTDGRLIDKVASINRRILPIINNFIYLKKDIINKLDTQKIYMHYYNSMLKHFIQEELKYYNIIHNIQKNIVNSTFINENIDDSYLIKNHLDFVKDMLDPIEEQDIALVNYYQKEYDDLFNNDKNLNNFNNRYIELIIKIRDFFQMEEEKIINNQVKSIITPLYIDHAIREMNYVINRKE